MDFRKLIINLSNFRIKSTLASLVILASTVIPASSAFAQSIPIPANAIFGGYDFDGTPMYVCSGIWNNAVYGGKRRSDGNSCDMSYGGSEVFSSNFVVLTNPNQTNANHISKFYWEASSNQQPIPADAVPTGFENGYSLYSCRASYNGGTAIGKLTNLKLCYFGYSYIEAFTSSYDVLALTTYPSKRFP